MIVVELLGEPRGWARARVRVVTPRGSKAFPTFFKDAKTRAFEDALSWQAKAAMKGRAPLKGAVSVRVTAAMEVPISWTRRERDAALAGIIRPTGKPDWDNFAGMLDAFNKIVWLDDAQVVDGSVTKIYSETPLLRVEVAPAEKTGGLL